MTRDFIQVAADGTGKKVSNVTDTEPQPVDASGNAQDDLVTYQQVVTLADEDGQLTTDLSARILGELEAIHAALDRILMHIE